jgi:hypothetical protein
MIDTGTTAPTGNAELDSGVTTALTYHGLGENGCKSNNENDNETAFFS